jgi:Flp pilus assembly pilin Flp
LHHLARLSAYILKVFVFCRRAGVAMEYSLIAAGLSIVILGAVQAVGSDVRDSFFNEIANAVSGP